MRDGQSHQRPQPSEEAAVAGDWPPCCLCCCAWALLGLAGLALFPGSRYTALGSAVWPGLRTEAPETVLEYSVEGSDRAR